MMRIGDSARALFGALMAVAVAAGSARAEATDSIPARLRAQLERSAGGIEIHGEPLHAEAAVRDLYRGTGFQGIWLSAGHAQARELLRFISTLDSDGLRPGDYHESALRAFLGRATPWEPSWEDELLLSDAALSAGHDLLRGRISARAMHPTWTLRGREVDLASAVAAAIRSGRVRDTLESLRPRSADYGRLRAALADYRDFEASGGWTPVPEVTLRPGDASPAIPALRARLRFELGVPSSAEDTLYDDGLRDAVMEFQGSRGLGVDGVIGPATRAALDVSVGRRIDQLRAALERERWLPASLGERHIVVRIPAFELEAVAPAHVLRMLVIAGKPSWRTPIFSAEMTAAVFNPYWNIPPSIWTREVAPRARRDPGYLAREGIHAVRGEGGVRWRQSPGPRNPLGEVKLVFPNRFNVYLHDTSSPALFGRADRALSHGCIRVQRPLELTRFALEESGWSEARIQREMAGHAERTVRLAAPIPVHILYRTAWVDEAGTVQFRPDLYGHDQRLIRALDESGASEP